MEIYTDKYDFPDYLGIPKKVICLWFIPRSGSNFLADEMRKTDKLGYPLEYFSYANVMALSKRLINEGGKDSIKDVFDFLIRTRTSPNGVFAYKWNSAFDSRFDMNGYIKTYNLFIDRRDRVRQAESYFIARKYNDWLGSRSNHSEAISAKDLSETMYFLENIRENTMKMLSNKETLGIYYENFVGTPKTIIKKILNFVEE